MGSDCHHWRMCLFFFPLLSVRSKLSRKFIFPYFCLKHHVRVKSFEPNILHPKHFCAVYLLCTECAKAFMKDKNNSKNISLVDRFMHHHSLSLSLSFLLRLCTQVETVALPFCKTRKKRAPEKRVSLISFSFVNANELN